MTLFPGSPRGASSSRAQLVGQGLIMAAILATLLLAISPTPYVVERPGPVYDTLGTTEVDGEKVPVIDISGAETFPTDGRLDLLTVYLDGSREQPLDWFDVIAAWFDPTRAILPDRRRLPRRPDAGAVRRGERPRHAGVAAGRRRRRAHRTRHRLHLDRDGRIRERGLARPTACSSRATN